MSPNPSGKPKQDLDVTPSELDRFDGWSSALTGIGTAERDKRLSHQISVPTLTYQQICDLWAVDDVAKRAIEAPGDESFREGYEITIGDEGSYDNLKEAVEEKLLELGVDAKLKRAHRLERAFGGSAILMGADDGRALDTPLQMSRVESIDWLNVLEPLEIYPVSYYENPVAPKFGEPEFYQVNNFSSMNGGGVAPKSTQKSGKALTAHIHESRLITFEGQNTSNYAPKMNLVAPNWGDSALLSMVEILRDFNIAWHSAGILVTDFAQPVITLDNLMQLVSKNAEGLRVRMAALELSRSTARAILIGKGEKFERQTTSLSGLPEVLLSLAQRLSAATGIPLMMLLGVSAAGLGNPSATDLNIWYNYIRSIQKDRFTQPLRMIIKMIMQSLRKRKIPKKWGVRWNELERLSDHQRAEARLVMARHDELYIKYGVLSPDDVRTARFGGEYSYETPIDEKKKAPGFMAKLPTGVVGGVPGAPGTSGGAPGGGAGGPGTGRSPGAHTVGGYTRRDPNVGTRNVGDAIEYGETTEERSAQRRLEAARKDVEELRSFNITSGEEYEKAQAACRLAQQDLTYARRRGDRMDGDYTAQAELEHQELNLLDLLKRGAKPDSAAAKTIGALIDITKAELEACTDGSCGDDCIYDHPWRADAVFADPSLEEVLERVRRAGASGEELVEVEGLARTDIEAAWRLTKTLLAKYNNNLDEDGDGKRVSFAGFTIVIESPKGSYRYWTDTDGTPGKTLMRHNYGYIEGSFGADGDSVDTYLGPNPNAEWVYIVHQNKKPDFLQFDEDKCLIGFDSANHARDAYLSMYDDERFFGSMDMMTLESFRRKVMYQAGGKITNTDAEDADGSEFDRGVSR